MKNALILHGTDATPNSNWFTWLKNELEKHGYTVWLPQLPQADRPNTKRYNEFIFRNRSFQFTEETIIIGHSSGSVEAMSLVDNLPEKTHVKAIYLVSCFCNDLGWTNLKGLFEEKLNYRDIKSKAKKIVLIHSDNDPYVPLEQAKYLKNKLNAELFLFHDQGHFNLENSEKYNTFPELPDIILK